MTEISKKLNYLVIKKKKSNKIKLGLGWGGAPQVPKRGTVPGLPAL